MNRKTRAALACASIAAISAALPAGTATAMQMTHPAQATYAGNLNGSRTAGSTHTCTHQPDTSTPLKCSLSFTLKKDICTIAPTALNVGTASYSAYNGRFTSDPITLHGNGTRVGILVGTAFLADEARFIKVSVDASPLCDEITTLLPAIKAADGVVGGGAFEGEATYTVSSTIA